MLWAVIKLYFAIRSSKALSTLLNQRMIMVHVVTLLIYLVSVSTYYIFFWLWQYSDNVIAENKVYVTWAISNIFLSLV